MNAVVKRMSMKVELQVYLTVSYYSYIVYNYYESKTCDQIS